MFSMRLANPKSLRNGPGYCMYGSKACFQNAKTIQTVEVKPTIRKQTITRDVIQSFESSHLVAVYHYNDMNCQEWNRIRNRLANKEIKLKVVPAKLSSKILQATKYKNITPLIKGCTAIAFGKDAAYVSDLLAATKKEGKLHMMGGIVDQQIFTPQGMQQCARLQPLLSQHMVLSRSLTAVQSQLSGSLLSSQQNLCSQIGRIHDPKE